MPLIPAICTQCGAQIEVDQSKEAAICPHCGTAFIVEKAINNYNIQNATINAQNVNVHTPVYETLVKDTGIQDAKELQEYINLMSIFGWDYKEKERIKDVISAGDYEISLKGMRITFQRDTAASWFNPRIVELEKEYFALLDEFKKLESQMSIVDTSDLKEPEPRKGLCIPAIILVLASIITTVCSFSIGGFKWPLFFAALGILGAAALLVFIAWLDYKGQQKSYLEKKYYREHCENYSLSIKKKMREIEARTDQIENECIDMMVAKFGRRITID